jgi:tRNA-dihydrouridine synthase
MMAHTGCDGVVAGRGCLGRPWLFRDLDDALAGREVSPPPRLGDVVDAMRRHVRLLVDDIGDEQNAVRDFRKHVGWYLTGYPIGGEPRRRMALTSSVDELDAMLADLDPTLELPDAARRAKRGHTNGPRPVALPHRWIENAEQLAVPQGGELLVSGG